MDHDDVQMVPLSCLHERPSGGGPRAGACPDRQERAGAAGPALTEPLGVLPAGAGGGHAVVTGLRRLRSLRALAASGVVDDDHPVRCRVLRAAPAAGPAPVGPAAGAGAAGGGGPGGSAGGMPAALKRPPEGSR